MSKFTRHIEKKSVGSFFDYPEFDNLEINEKDYQSLILGYKIIKKDTHLGDRFKIVQITPKDNNKIEILTDSYINLEINLKKEKKLFTILSENKTENLTENTNINEWLLENEEWLKNNLEVEIVDNKEINKGSLISAYLKDTRKELYEQIKISNKPYQALIKSRNDGGFFADIQGVEVFIPGSLAAANKISNFNDLIGKQIDVMIEDYLYDGDTFIASNKKYINHILPLLLKEIDLDAEYTGKITGVMKFGVFIEFNSFMTGLLHYSEMSRDVSEQFTSDQLKAGHTINFFIKEIDKSNRLILTNSKLNVWSEFKKHCEGVDMEGEIFKITSFGLLIDFNFLGNVVRGLMLFKNLHNHPNSYNFERGDKYIFNIEKVFDEEKKIHLKLISK